MFGERVRGRRPSRILGRRLACLVFRPHCSRILRQPVCSLLSSVSERDGCCRQLAYSVGPLYSCLCLDLYVFRPIFDSAKDGPCKKGHNLGTTLRHRLFSLSHNLGSEVSWSEAILLVKARAFFTLFASMWLSV